MYDQDLNLGIIRWTINVVSNTQNKMVLFLRNKTITYNHQQPSMSTCFGIFPDYLQANILQQNVQSVRTIHCGIPLYPMLCAASIVFSISVCRIVAVPVFRQNRRYRCTMGCPEGKSRLLHRALTLERCSFPVLFVVKCQRQNAPCAKHFPKCVQGTVRIIFHRN